MQSVKSVLCSTTNIYFDNPPPETRNKNNLKALKDFSVHFFSNGINLQYRMFSVVFMSGIAEHLTDEPVSL